MKEEFFYDIKDKEAVFYMFKTTRYYPNGAYVDIMEFRPPKRRR